MRTVFESASRTLFTRHGVAHWVHLDVTHAELYELATSLDHVTSIQSEPKRLLVIRAPEPSSDGLYSYVGLLSVAHVLQSKTDKCVQKRLKLKWIVDLVLRGLLSGRPDSREEAHVQHW